LALVGVVALGVGLFLGRRDDGNGREPPGIVNERVGAYRGVAVGASEDDVRRVFGHAEESGPFAPLGTSFGEVGVASPVPVWPPGSYERPRVFRYRDVALLVGRQGIFAFVLSEKGARTLRGVRVGDSLARARQTYKLRCGEQVYGESLLGGSVTFPYCSGTLDRGLRIWFGRDPIRSITVYRVGRG